MKTKDKRPYVIALVSVLVLLVVVLVGYIVFSIGNKDKEEVVEVETTTTSTTTVSLQNDLNKWEKILGVECLNEKVDDECLLYQDNEITLSLKDYKIIKEDGYESVLEVSYNIYLNNKVIREDVKGSDSSIGYICSYKITNIDDGYILLEDVYDESSEYTLYDKDGNLLRKFNGTYLIYEDSEFRITYTKRYVDWKAVHHCGEIGENDIFESKSIIPYLGNGMLGEETIVSRKTLSDVLYEECQVRTCDEESIEQCKKIL